MTEQQRKFLLSAIILGIICLGGTAYYYFTIAKVEIESLKDQIAKKEEQKKTIQDKIDAYEVFLEQRELIEATINAIILATERLPDSPNDQRYLKLVAEFIDKTGISLEAMATDRDKKYQHFTELPNLVEGSTRYSDFVQFLALSEQNAQLFMRVNQFLLDNDPEAPELHPFSLTLSTFIFND